jgi:hypothetical protein
MRRFLSHIIQSLLNHHQKIWPTQLEGEVIIHILT